jgi:hypothetical protein
MVALVAVEFTAACAVPLLVLSAVGVTVTNHVVPVPDPDPDAVSDPDPDAVSDPDPDAVPHAVPDAGPHANLLGCVQTVEYRQRPLRLRLP